MLDFLVLILIVGGLLLFAWGVFEALGKIASHMRDNPDAAKAIVEHVFMPLFGGKKEPERNTPAGTAMVIRNASAEEPSERN
jgi:uncharacterized protein YneF (UPF0154 family)